VLDVGGWFGPFNLATHVVDLAPYETRQTSHAFDPENAERFSADTWCQIDACCDPWPFTDDYFDFSTCSHTLEDVPDPVAICRQLVRVSKAGYIEVPSKLREIFTKQRWVGLRSMLRQPLDIGFSIIIGCATCTTTELHLSVKTPTQLSRHGPMLRGLIQGERWARKNPVSAYGGQIVSILSAWKGPLRISLVRSDCGYPTISAD